MCHSPSGVTIEPGRINSGGREATGQILPSTRLPMTSVSAFPLFEPAGKDAVPASSNGIPIVMAVAVGIPPPVIAIGILLVAFPEFLLPGADELRGIGFAPEPAVPETGGEVLFVRRDLGVGAILAGQGSHLVHHPGGWVLNQNQDKLMSHSPYSKPVIEGGRPLQSATKDLNRNAAPVRPQNSPPKREALKLSLKVQPACSRRMASSRSNSARQRRAACPCADLR